MIASTEMLFFRPIQNRKAVFGACPVSFETMSTPLRRSVSCFLMLFSEHLGKSLRRVLGERMPLRSDKE